MIRKLSLLLTIIAALGIIIALVSGCGKKGSLQAPTETAQYDSRPT